MSIAIYSNSASWSAWDAEQLAICARAWIKWSTYKNLVLHQPLRQCPHCMDCHIQACIMSRAHTMNSFLISTRCKSEI